jgi:hypothetical protein
MTLWDCVWLEEEFMVAFIMPESSKCIEVPGRE